MLKQKATFERGDTIVEVLFAVAVFSLIAIGTMLIMNQGAATAQRGLEVTLVRQEIDAQAEALRFLNASYIHNYQSYSSNPYSSTWQQIDTNYTVSSPTTFGSASSCLTSLPTKSFILNTKKAELGPTIQPAASTFSRVIYSGNVATSAEGLWIEAVKVAPVGSSQDNAGYIDFHIRACWNSIGQTLPVTLGTIVRLYEPRG